MGQLNSLNVILMQTRHFKQISHEPYFKGLGAMHWYGRTRN